MNESQMKRSKSDYALSACKSIKTMRLSRRKANLSKRPFSLKIRNPDNPPYHVSTQASTAKPAAERLLRRTDKDTAVRLQIVQES